MIHKKSPQNPKILNKRGEIETMIWEFFYENRVALLITLVGGIPVFLYTLISWEHKQRYERHKKAKETVIDNLESLFINNQSVSLEIIKHLISATEREQIIELKDPPKNLLEDLELRFEKSKHLNTERRTYYIEQIEEIISKIETESKEGLLPIPLADLLTSLKENIETGEKDRALNDLDKLSFQFRRLVRIAKYPGAVILEPPMFYFIIIFYIIISLIIFFAL